MTATAGGTGIVYHKERVSSRVNTNTLDTRRRLYGELAYCRLMLARKRALGRPSFVEFYREETARTERLLSARRRPPQPVAGTESLTRQINSWVEMVEAAERREAA